MLLFYYIHFRTLKYFFTILSKDYVYKAQNCIILNKNLFFRMKKGRTACYEIIIPYNPPIFYFDFIE